MTPLNPLTPLTLAACGMVFVLVADHVYVSAAAWILAAAISLSSHRSRRALITAAVISTPPAVGFMLMYAPFEGFDVALILALRFLAATSIALVCGSFINLDELMRTLQTRAPAKLVYIVGSTSRLYPMAKERLATIRQIRTTRGLRIRGFRANCALVLPLVVGLVDDAAQRSRPLQRTGIGIPGSRTVLNPVPDTRRDHAIRILAIACTIAGLAWAIGALG